MAAASAFSVPSSPLSLAVSAPAPPPITRPRRLSFSTSREGRVLSVQSHTVHGYVGNKSAVFPLQLLGIDVDPVNSVQFSNHTGYAAGVRGQVLGGDELSALREGLGSAGILAAVPHTHLLTGYIGSLSFLEAVHGCEKKINFQYQKRGPDGRPEVVSRETGVDIPAGVDTGMTLQVPGQGADGDPLVDVVEHGWVSPQSTFTGSWTKAAAVSPSFMAMAA